MNNIDIVLRNCCGCEIARVSIGTNEDPAKALIRVVEEEKWALDEGDTISFESAWHEGGN